MKKPDPSFQDKPFMNRFSTGRMRPMLIAVAISLLLAGLALYHARQPSETMPHVEKREEAAAQALLPEQPLQADPPAAGRPKPVQPQAVATEKAAQPGKASRAAIARFRKQQTPMTLAVLHKTG